MLEKEELEEERRLCYVGITRAKQKLFLIFARRRLYFGTYGSNLVSRFLREIPEGLLEASFPSHTFDDDTTSELSS
jgi:DNA helicase-2/ATP-dependent DNA helicase PcrA